MRLKRHTTRRKDAIPIKLFGNTGKKKPKNNTSAPADTTVSTPAPEVNTEKPEINAEKTPAPKKKSGKVGIIIGIVVVVIIAAAAAGIFAVDRIDTVYPGVTVNDIDISGMTEEEAAAAISDIDVNGKTYLCEEFTVDGATAKYCFDGNDLKYIITNPDGTEAFLEILSYSKDVDESLFEIPTDYMTFSM